MKKSQVLAALALAFALGVVAPAANTMVAANTYATNAELTADACSVKNEIARIENYGPYKSFKSLFDDVEAIEGAMPNDLPAKINAVITNYNNIYRTANLPAYVAPAAPTAAGFISVYNSAKTTVSGQSYTNWVRLYNDMKDSNVSFAELTGAILAIDGGYVTTYRVGTATYNKEVSTIKTEIQSTWTFKPLYDAYVNMIKEVEVADKIVNGMNDAKEILRNLQGSDKYTDIQNAYDGGPATLDAYVKGIDGYTEYANLVSYIENTVKKNLGSTDVNLNLQFLDNLDAAVKAATKAATKTELGLFGNAQIDAFKGTCGVADDSNKPSDGTGDNQNKPTEGDNKAPNTGALTNAEGSASTTVAMVAGIATALTAAGAGVVAYRNARRSTRK